MADFGDLMREVRTGDYDRFLCIQLAPAHKRAGLYILTAFHLELARIAETVSEPMLGQIRLTWWREALEQIIKGETPRNHPVVLGLAELYKQLPALFTPLLAMIDARAADIGESLLRDEQGWRNYLRGTAGALHEAWALWLNETVAKAERDAIYADAQNFAVVGLLRAIPFMHAQGFMRFPQTNLDAYEVVSLEPSRQLAKFTLDTLAGITWGKSPVSRSLRPLRGLRALARLHSLRLQKAGGDVFRVVPARLAAVWRMYKIKYF